MLTISYAQAISNDTLCDTGKAGADKLLALFETKKNESRPIKEILPYLNVAEILWCLRVVKGSQAAEADDVARRFITSVTRRIEAEHILRFNEKVEAAQGWSQMAIDASAAAIQYARYSGKEKREEALQRKFLKENL